MRRIINEVQEPEDCLHQLQFMQEQNEVQFAAKNCSWHGRYKNLFFFSASGDLHSLIALIRCKNFKPLIWMRPINQSPQVMHPLRREEEQRPERSIDGEEFEGIRIIFENMFHQIVDQKISLCSSPSSSSSRSLSEISLGTWVVKCPGL